MACLVTALLLPAQAGATLVGQAKWGGIGTGPGQFRNPGQVVVDVNGNVFVTDGDNQRVQKFSPTGTLVTTFGSSGTGDGQFGDPLGFASTAAGDLFVGDFTQHTIQRFTNDGTFVLKFPAASGTAPGQLGSVGDLAIAADGGVWVGDSGNNRVEKFDQNGNFTGIVIGGPGTGPGQFDRPRGLAVDADGNLYVAEGGNARIQKFDPNGVFIRVIGGPTQFRGLSDLTIDASGNMWVANTDNFRIDRYDLDGNFISSSDKFKGTQIRPASISAAPDGSIYALNYGTNEIMRFVDDGDPVLGKSATVRVVKGTVLVKPRGLKTFQKVTGTDEIPIGSTVDTVKGTVRLTTAKNLKGSTQTGDFYSGLFLLQQQAKVGAVTDLRLSGGLFGGCGKLPKGGASAAKGPKAVRKLWGKATGAFRTTGRYSAATVRGTTWLVQDRCDGTLTRVTSGVVSVRDFVRRKTITVRKGKSYFAARRG
ncbi:MAG: tripartite motif-containing protein 71 [Thermoleophilaceae bacterium]|nr:tripartite motif-containing protein 71 [Thermoleophilaceae bacterium]